MISKFKEFEKLDNINTKPNLNLISDKFWNMIELANWKSYVDAYKNNKTRTNIHIKIFKYIQGRLFDKYTLREIIEFEKEYNGIYYELKDYYKNIWLDKKYNFMPSDDGYSDLISTMIGFGKEFIKEAIENTDLFIQLAKDEYFAENFAYLFMVNPKEYDEIKDKYNPIAADAEKYNI